MGPAPDRRRFAGPLLALALVAACGGPEPPEVAGGPPVGAPAPIVRTSGLLAGPERPEAAMPNPYGEDEVVIADGERYYNWFNCAGCHGGAGGGGIGPPFADGDWIYGGEPANIFQSIVQGRPNGMPSFGRQIPDEQIWKLVAYVRSLSPRARGVNGGGESGGSGAPGRPPPDPGGERGGGGAR